MIANDVIELAKSAELKQLSTAIKDDVDVVMGYINLGILELHKRFRLVQKEAVITMADGISEYRLDGTDTNVVIDLSVNSLLMVDDVFDEDEELMILNEEEKNSCSLLTPSYNVIKVPEKLIEDGAKLKVVYRAAPKFLADENASVPLPPQFLEALLHYVGYRGHSSVNGDIKHQNNTHYLRFDKSCKLIESQGLFTESSLTSSKFTDRGFV